MWIKPFLCSDITLKYSREAYTNSRPNESLGSPLSEKHIGFEFGQFLHTLNVRHGHLALWILTINYGALYIQHEEKKQNVNETISMFGYNFKSIQERPTNLYPNKSLGSALSHLKFGIRPIYRNSAILRNAIHKRYYNNYLLLWRSMFRLWL